MIRGLFLFGFWTVIMSSCYVTHPPYATVEEVMQVELGMTKEVVDSLLHTGPYDLIGKYASGDVAYIYKYRLSDVRRVPKAMKRNSGLSVEGRFKDLALTYDKGNVLVKIGTQEPEIEDEVKKRKVDVMALIDTVTTFVSVTLPSLLVYLSVQ